MCYQALFLHYQSPGPNSSADVGMGNEAAGRGKETQPEGGSQGGSVSGLKKAALFPAMPKEMLQDCRTQKTQLLADHKKLSLSHAAGCV